jgi:hypothetical protein
MEVFNEDGTFTVPDGVTTIMVEVWGGGGGGGTADSNDTASGGGGGGYGKQVFTVTPGDRYTVTVGQGGADSTPGGTTSFGSLISALGGGGGTVLDEVVDNVFGGIGGTSDATVNIAGSDGQNTNVNADFIGVDGGSAGGGGGSGGHAPNFDVPSPGLPGNIPGGGGSSSDPGSSGTGGAGANGRVIVYY